MKKILLYFLLCSFIGSAQKQANTWYFGDKAGLHFINGNPTAITNGQTPTVDCTLTCHSEGSSVMSDSSGALLFYTNGETVWNKQQQVMPNGSGLKGHPSSTQVLIVPKPGSKRYYYIFTTPGYQANFTDGLRYSVVDMCAQNGMGDVLSNEKNIKILDTIAEKVTGVIHTNGTDYWIITHKFWSRNFHAFQLTSTGITTTVVTTIGNNHPPGNGTAKVAAIGQIKASPDGQKIAIVCGNSGTAIAEYFNFNAATGVLSNSVNIHNTPICQYYGASFSPDNSKLYISTLSCGSSTINSGIYQYDLNRGGGHADSVRASKKRISGNGTSFFALQLATNGKIYSTRSPLPGHQYVSCINSPNVAGAGCNYLDSAVFLNGKAASYGLPNFIDSFRYLEVQTGNDACPTPTSAVGIVEGQMSRVTITPNPFNSHLRIESVEAVPLSFILRDVVGRVVYSTELKSEMAISVDLSTLVPGVYYYRVEEGNQVKKQGKLLKQ